jgi:acetyl esterase/lipase
MPVSPRLLLPLALWIILLCTTHAAEPRKLFLAHYMPWYTTQHVSGEWGWHWTMNHFDPERIQWDAKRDAASHDSPLIGLYDSSDPHALECHALLMKFAGLDGVIIDWYGTANHLDFASNHRHTQQLLPWLKKAGLRFALCYEDKSLEAASKASAPDATSPLAQAQQDFQWAQKAWFSDPAYVRLENRPIALVFGPQFLPKEHWNTLQSSLSSHPLLFGLPHLGREHGLDGIFGWPPVEGGKTLEPTAWKKSLETLHARSKQGERVIATAFPGFRDIYKQAGVHDSYGSISSRYGATFRESLELATQSEAPIVQIATWNDYGEGTMIEPTRHHGFRFLEILQNHLRHQAHGIADLRLPVALYQLRKRALAHAPLQAQLDQAAELLFQSQCTRAESLLAQVSAKLGTLPAVFPENPFEESPDYRLVSDVLYRDGANLPGKVHQRCRLDLYFPANKPQFPTVLWFHGGGLTIGERAIPMQLRRRGIGVVAVNYRLSPEARSPEYLEDAAAALAWTFKHIAHYGGDASKIFVSGHSAGAYLTLMLGMDKRWLAPHGIAPRQIAGLIPLSPQTITHFAIREERGIDEKQPLVDELAPLFHVQNSLPPCLLVTGDREKELLGRYEETAYFWRMLKLNGNSTATLHELQGFDHGTMPEPAMPLLLRFIEKHSPKPPAR